MQRAHPPTPRAAVNAPPAVTNVELTDPAAFGEGMKMIDLDAVQLDVRPIHVRRVAIRLGSSTVLFQATDQPIRTRTTLQPGLVAYVAFGPRAAGTVNGLRIGPDRILAGAAGVKVELVVAAGYESVSLFVSPDDVRARLRGGRCDVESMIPRGFKLWQTSPGAGPGIFEWGRRVAEEAAGHPERFDDPKANAIAQRQLFEMLHANIASAVESERAPRDGTRCAYSRIVHTAEEYALEHAAAPLYVTELCKAASVSERTLQNAFREILGMTPISYLKQLRLHRMRRALQTATPHSTTVSAEALKWGFWHLGELSRVYKECFGESPKATFRQGHGNGSAQGTGNGV